MLLHVDVMSLHVGVMRRAICDCDILHVDVMSEHVGVMRRAIFDYDLRLRYFLWTRLVRVLSLSDSLSDACAHGRDAFARGWDDSDSGF